jgi:hypothetical protein
MTGAGFPHSDISGSKRVCRSPKLFAAYRVLHHLMTPRHPSIALAGLITFSDSRRLIHLPENFHILDFQRTKFVIGTTFDPFPVLAPTVTTIGDPESGGPRWT